VLEPINVIPEPTVLVAAALVICCMNDKTMALADDALHDALGCDVEAEL
jgi:hypothetical protein